MRGYSVCFYVRRKDRRLNEARNKEFMEKKGYKACPGCGLMIAKNEGCNHMTHNNCPNALRKSDGCTHFCYTCGDTLYDFHTERDGSVHFPNGLFSDCRKAILAREKGYCVVM